MIPRAPLIIGLFLMSLLSFFGCSERAEEPRAFAPTASVIHIDVAHWRETPCLKDKAATQEDVGACRAVFAAPGSSSRSIDLNLPRCAIHTDQQTGKKTPVIVIQAEDVGGTKTIGFRSLLGAEGVCLLSELELLDGPDERFK
jgi:hypothetical protein